MPEPRTDFRDLARRIWADDDRVAAIFKRSESFARGGYLVRNEIQKAVPGAYWDSRRKAWMPPKLGEAGPERVLRDNSCFKCGGTGSYNDATQSKTHPMKVSCCEGMIDCRTKPTKTVGKKDFRPDIRIALAAPPTAQEKAVAAGLAELARLEKAATAPPKPKKKLPRLRMSGSTGVSYVAISVALAVGYSSTITMQHRTKQTLVKAQIAACARSNEIRETQRRYVTLAAKTSQGAARREYQRQLQQLERVDCRRLSQP